MEELLVHAGCGVVDTARVSPACVGATGSLTARAWSPLITRENVAHAPIDCARSGLATEIGNVAQVGPMPALPICHLKPAPSCR